MVPYALPADRARALYRIPTAPQRNRTLEICHAREPLLPGFAWPGEGHRACMMGSEPLPTPPQCFDLVILHRTLDDLASSQVRGDARFDATAWLRGVVDLLVPGGLVAGCVDNRNDPRQRLRGPGTAWLTAGRLRQLLAGAGLADIRLFSLLPSCDAPLKLVDTDAAASRLAFRRELETERRYMSRTAYVARRLLIESGLSRHIEPALFFWGYRAC